MALSFLWSYMHNKICKFFLLLIWAQTIQFARSTNIHDSSTRHNTRSRNKHLKVLWWQVGTYGLKRSRRCWLAKLPQRRHHLVGHFFGQNKSGNWLDRKVAIYPRLGRKHSRVNRILLIRKRLKRCVSCKH